MPYFLHSKTPVFPPQQNTDYEGLLAIGGEMNAEWLIAAYKKGIFPWYNPDDLIMWWCPDPRFVLFPSRLKVSKSMQAILKTKKFRFTVNTSFRDVIENCRTTPRHGSNGSWLNDEMIEAYTELHRMGYAHSAETWQNDVLVGGLYGIRMGNVFFGESMFHHLSNASKFAFINYVQMLEKEQITLIDCQMPSEHLKSLGAEFISRKDFLNYLPLSSSYP